MLCHPGAATLLLEHKDSIDWHKTLNGTDDPTLNLKYICKRHKRKCKF